LISVTYGCAETAFTDIIIGLTLPGPIELFNVDFYKGKFGAGQG
jgi:hypothetical protein